MKKFLLGLGALASVAAPVAAVISCNKDDTPKKSADQISVDEIKAMFADFAMGTSATHTAVAAGTTFDDTAMKGIGSVITPTGFTFPTDLDGVSMTFELEEIKAEEKAYSGTITFIKNDVTETKTFTVTKTSQDAINVNKAKALFNGLSLEGDKAISTVTTAVEFNEAVLTTAELGLYKDGKLVATFPDFKNVVVKYSIPTAIEVPTGDTDVSKKGKMVIEITSGEVKDTVDLDIQLYSTHYLAVKNVIASVNLDDLMKLPINGSDANSEVLPSTITEQDLLTVIKSEYPKVSANGFTINDITIAGAGANDVNGKLTFKIGTDDTTTKEFELTGFKSQNPVTDLTDVLSKFGDNQTSTLDKTALEGIGTGTTSAAALGITTPSNLPADLDVAYEVITPIGSGTKVVVKVTLTKKDGSAVTNNTKEINVAPKAATPKTDLTTDIKKFGNATSSKNAVDLKTDVGSMSVGGSVSGAQLGYTVPSLSNGVTATFEIKSVYDDATNSIKITVTLAKDGIDPSQTTNNTKDITITADTTTVNVDFTDELTKYVDLTSTTLDTAAMNDGSYTTRSMIDSSTFEATYGVTLDPEIDGTFAATYKFDASYIEDSGEIKIKVTLTKDGQTADKVFTISASDKS